MKFLAHNEALIETLTLTWGLIAGLVVIPSVRGQPTLRALADIKFEKLHVKLARFLLVLAVKQAK